MKYEVVKYRPEYKRQVVELQKHLWSRDVGVNGAYLEWKYERNPYMETPLVYVVLHGTEVVGMRGMFGVEWEVGNPSQLVCKVCAGDLVIHPEHRNRGLFGRIMDAAMNDLAHNEYPYVFNLSSTLATHLGSLTTGWRSAGVLETARLKAGLGKEAKRPSKDVNTQRLFMRVYRPIEARARKLGIIRRDHRRNPFYYLDREGRGHLPKANEYVSVEKTPRPDAMADLVERIGTDGRIRHRRDQRYLGWRFLNPLSMYRFLFWEDTRLEGYLVLQTPTFGGDRRKVSVVDWEGTSEQVRADLLQSAIDRGTFDEVMLWSETLPDETKTLLRGAGFTIADETTSVGRAFREGAYRPSIKVRAVSNAMLNADWTVAGRRLLDLANWDLRMIYSDSF